MRNKKIGFIFQKYNLLPRISAVENVELPLRYSDDSSNIKNVLKKRLVSVGLADACCTNGVSFLRTATKGGYRAGIGLTSRQLFWQTSQTRQPGLEAGKKLWICF